MLLLLLLLLCSWVGNPSGAEAIVGGAGKGRLLHWCRGCIKSRFSSGIERIVIRIINFVEVQMLQSIFNVKFVMAIVPVVVVVISFIRRANHSGRCSSGCCIHGGRCNFCAG